MFSTPFSRFTPTGQGWLLGVCLALLGASGLGNWLTTRQLKPGIVAYELAGTLQRSQAIIDAWTGLPLGRGALLRAAFSLGLDYVFIVGYVGTLGLSCTLLTHVFRAPAAAALGVLLAWGQIVAGLLDSVENAALIQMLFRSVEEPWPMVARSCAVVKFALVLSGATYVIVGLIALLPRRS